MSEPTPNNATQSVPNLTSQQTPNKEHINAEKDFTPNEYEDYGYFFYHNRLNKDYKLKWYDVFLTFGGSNQQLRKMQCEMNVENAVKNHPGVKLMFSAMKKCGCEPSLTRHFSCEHCHSAVKGGFDPSTNQIVVCHNTVNSFSANDVAKSMIPSLIEAFDYCRGNYDTLNLEHLACSKVVLCYNNLDSYKDTSSIVLHELVHAFDHCRAHIDYSNNYHVACTEIRAANLTGCSLWDTFRNEFSYFTLANMHKECVRQTAAISVQMVRNITKKEALAVVDKVFEKCYNDTEPFGRRVRNYEDYERAYLHRKKLGYE